MAYNEQLANKIRVALADLREVEEKRMFGGLAFIVNGKMCITVGKDRIMCRIDPSLQNEAIEREGIEPVEMRGRQYKGYVHISQEVLEAKKDFDYWVELALTFNKIAKASKKSVRGKINQ